MKLRDYQDAAVNSIFDYFASGKAGNPIVGMPTGCHAKGQGILLYSGEIRSVEAIEVGDLLMGPDSRPRKVLQLCRGRQEMRRVTPTQGAPWIVNKDHILALYKCKERSNSTSKCHKGAHINIPVCEFENRSTWFQHIHKLYRVEVEFPTPKDILPVDPYLMGVFLGDGNYTHSQVNVTSMDPEILEYCEKQILSFGDKVRYHSNGSKASCIFATTGIRNRTRRSHFATLLDGLGLRGKDSFSKFIPYMYKTSPRASRLQLLAGLVDTDGSYSGSYEYTTVSKQLAEDVAFVGRSLGFGVTSKFKAGGSHGYYRLHISGDLTSIPVLLERKKANPRAQIKNVQVTGFKIEKLSEDDYYGFELDGDHLYLLDDFTVTHNTGKSLVIGGFIQKALAIYPYTRVMKLTHSKELISQNLDKLLELWPTAPAGVYSSGLKRKDAGFPITFGGVGTVVKAKPDSFGRIDLLLIDECHLLSPKENTMYQKVITGLKKINPHLKVVGFTATHYRLGQGLLTEPGGLFTDICFDMTSMVAFNWLLAEGYVSPLIPKKTSTVIDLSGVHIQGGEFKQNELQDAVDKDSITYAAVQEMILCGEDRYHWLVFASGIEHTSHVATMLNEAGVPATFVHSLMPDNERDQNIADFKAGKYRAMVNNGILTTGFDFPGIDLIGMLRPTQSTSLWVQMLGRGTRPVYVPGFDLSTREGRLLSVQNGPKQNCLVLDFAGNTRRLGPINDPVLPRKKGKGSGEAPVRLCEACGTYIHASLTVCPVCKAEFTRYVKIQAHAGTDALIATGEEVKSEVFEVDRVTYAEHRKLDRPPTIAVNYYCGLRMFKEWVCPEHLGFAAVKARKWWRERSKTKPPATTMEALERLEELATPTHIWVKLQPKGFDEVTGCCFDGSGFGGNQ